MEEDHPGRFLPRQHSLRNPRLLRTSCRQDFIKGGDEVLTLNLAHSQSIRILPFASTGRVFEAMTSAWKTMAKKDLSSFEASGNVAISNPRNRIDLLYFQASDRSHVTDRQSTSTQRHSNRLFARRRSQRLLPSGRLSVLLRQDATVEVAGAFGFYGGQFKYNLSASGRRDGQPVQFDTTHRLQCLCHLSCDLGLVHRPTLESLR